MVQYLEVNDNNQLNNLNKINKRLNSKKCNLITIYMPGCVHCEMLHPEWKISAKKLNKVTNNDGIVSFVNMQYMNQLNINTSSVYGFPHIVAIKNGQQHIYIGPRDNESLFKWMLTMCPSQVHTIVKKKKQTRKRKISSKSKTSRKRKISRKRKPKRKTKRKN